jgi:hypothetical protein
VEAQTDPSGWKNFRLEKGVGDLERGRCNIARLMKLEAVAALYNRHNLNKVTSNGS